MSIKMAPSILSADFMNLQKDVQLISQGGADFIHFDVMDGHFVPNLTLGVPFVKAMKAITDTPLDVHLMISNPEIQVPWYLQAGADIVSIHIEACDSTQQCLEVLAMISDAGAKCGIAINPETPAEQIYPVLEHVDMVLVMSVHPGFGGQAFIESTPAKVRQIKQECARLGVDLPIEIDGGIGIRTAPTAANAGVDILVAGSAVFRQPDPVAAMQAIRQSAQNVIEA